MDEIEIWFSTLSLFTPCSALWMSIKIEDGFNSSGMLLLALMRIFQFIG